MASCQKDESGDISKPDTSIEKAYDIQKTSAANKEINYTPMWTEKQESNGDVYVPLKADKIIRQIIGGKKQQPINDNIWLRGKLKDGKWIFSILQVYPDNYDNKYKSGMVIYEDLVTGKLSKSSYVDPSLNKDSDPVSSENGSPAKKAVDEQPPCKQVLIQVCAGEGAEMACDTRVMTICEDDEEDNGPIPPTTPPPPGLGGGVILPPDLVAASNTPNVELGEFEIDGCKTTLDEPDQKDPQQGDPKKVAKVDWKYATKRGTIITDWTDNTGRKHTHIKMDTYYNGFFKALVADFLTTGTGVNMIFDMFKAGKLVSPKSPGGFYADDAKYITEEMHEYYQAKQQRNQQNGTKCKP